MEPDENATGLGDGEETEDETITIDEGGVPLASFGSGTNYIIANDHLTFAYHYDEAETYEGDTAFVGSLADPA